MIHKENDQEGQSYKKLSDRIETGILLMLQMVDLAALLQNLKTWEERTKE